eukprot:17357-Eustigmatos_ZCMA.PRE.1
MLGAPAWAARVEANVGELANLKDKSRYQRCRTCNAFVAHVFRYNRCPKGEGESKLVRRESWLISA